MKINEADGAWHRLRRLRVRGVIALLLFLGAEEYAGI